MTSVALSMCTLSACGGATTQQVVRTVTVRSPPVVHSGFSDVLALSGLGAFEGSCPRGAPSWTLRFVVDPVANDNVSYRVGTGARRRVNIDPGNAITFHLIPDATKTHEPADRFVPPAGQAGRGVATAMMVPTTAPLQIIIYQATEPQELTADIRLALASGESGQCVLVGSSVKAYTYLNSSN
jgi:hypothetical protein